MPEFTYVFYFKKRPIHCRERHDFATINANAFGSGDTGDLAGRFADRCLRWRDDVELGFFCFGCLSEQFRHGGRRIGFDANTRADGNTCADSHPGTDGNAVADCDPRADGNAGSHSNAYAESVAHTFAVPKPFPHAITDADSHAVANTLADPEPHAESVTNAFAISEPISYAESVADAFAFANPFPDAAQCLRAAGIAGRIDQ